MTMNTNDLTNISNIVAAAVAKAPSPGTNIEQIFDMVTTQYRRLTDTFQKEETVSDTVSAAPVIQEKKAPVVSVKKSVTEDYIICLLDGLRFKSLKNHLNKKYGMTPDEYRAYFNLPENYPMVAHSYSVRRSELAKKFGLGRSPSKRHGKVTANAAPAKRGRKAQQAIAA